MSLFSELRKRNVFRVSVAYIVVAWLVIQVAETILPVFGFGDAAIRLVIIVLAIGLVPAAVFSWLFELTPEGLKRESAVDHSVPTAVQDVKRLDRAIMIVLTLAVGFFAFDKFVLDPVRDREIEESTAERVRAETAAEPADSNSIAVLPFVNMSGDDANEYFSDGMAEELLNLLARIPRLRVISQSSSFSLKGKGLTLPEMAERLNVALILEGSVRKSGDRVRITAQLIEARSDSHLWSETYDRTLDDVFAIQDEISTAIVAALKDQLELDVGAAPHTTGTASAEAHDAFLRGRYLAGQRVPGARSRAAEEFESAVALDPDFAPAHAELAIVLLLGGCGDVTAEECLARARPHSEKAMALDPGLAEAYAAAAWVSFHEDNPEQIRNHLRRALEINPNYAMAHVWMANMGLFGSPREAIAARETAVRLDPLSPLSNHSYIGVLLAQGRLEEADRHIEKYAAIDPKGAAVLRGVRSSLGGHWSNYLLAYLEVASRGTEDLSFAWSANEDMMWHLAALGLTDEAHRLMGEDNALAQSLLGDPQVGVDLVQAWLDEQPDSREAKFALARALGHAGQYAAARPWLEEGWQFLARISLDWGFSSFLNDLARALVVTLRDAGDEAGASRVVAEYRDLLRSYREAGLVQTQWNTSLDWFEGTAAYLAGEREGGLALMAKAAEDGFWITPPGAFEHSLHADPGFTPILEGQKARQAREQAKLLAVVCTDNPYAAVWQPAAETCERHFEGRVGRPAR